MTIRRLSLMLTLAMVAGWVRRRLGVGGAQRARSATGFLLNGRQLTPQGAQVTLGNFPTGGAVTADGRFLWTVSAGIGANDIRIVDTARRRVIQVIPIPGASGGIALDSRHRRAYVSGVAVSRWWPTQDEPAGRRGQRRPRVRLGRDLRAGAVRCAPSPSPTCPTPAAHAGPSLPATTRDQRLAAEAGGLARRQPPAGAAQPRRQRRRRRHQQARPRALRRHAERQLPVRRGDPARRAHGPGEQRGGRDGLGGRPAARREGPRHHRRPAALAPARASSSTAPDARAYVALSRRSTRSSSIDLQQLARRAHDLGGPQRRARARCRWRWRSARRARACSWPSRAPTRSPSSVCPARRPGPSSPGRWSAASRRPKTRRPWSTVAAQRRPARRGSCTSPPAASASARTRPGPVTTVPSTRSSGPSTRSPRPRTSSARQRHHLSGRHGRRPRRARCGCPSDAKVKQLAPAAARQIHPRDAQKAPAGTPLRAGGPIKHVFFIVRENRSYDQLLGDLGRGNGDPQLTIFGQDVTPNLHALVTRFPLLDHVFANSEASIQGHFWTAVGERPRLRRPQLGAGVRRARPAQRLRRLRRDLPGQRLPLRPGRAPAHLLLQLRRGVRGRRAAARGPRPFTGAARSRRSAWPPHSDLGPGRAPRRRDLRQRPGPSAR